MNTLLWITQILLAILFFYSGTNKLLLSRNALVNKGQTGVTELPVPAIRAIAVSELFGSIGILVPYWTGIAPQLTSLSASCFALIMVFAGIAHYRLLKRTGIRKEKGNMVTNLVVLLLSLFVAWGRL